ncbi:flagellar assembly protein FliH [Catenovulum sediminis]|uniref:Flagellar assembly protein FliH n=1 Tax=Catenovulum sediminis TaxID=1740262 RepID=A0ABV1RHL6_9ALTE|nr:flagellar assembly protein FliH [Catenovulum sediminis]
MVDDFKFRKSIRSDDEILKELKTWNIPIVESEANNKADDYTNALGKPEGWTYEEPEPEPEAPKPLTIEELEAIRQAAYEEGFAEGKEEGFVKGEAEGKEQGYQAGFEAGKEAGHQEGLESGTSIMEEKADIWNQLIQQLDNPLQKMDENVEKELLQLAVALAKAVINTELQTNDSIILQSIKQAVEKLPFNTKQCQIFVNPEDYETVINQYTTAEIERRNWHVSADPNISRGSVEIQTELTSITYTIEDRVREVFAQLEDQTG